MASGADKAEWNSFETNLYINLMLDEVKKGNMHGGNFNALAKKTIETEFVKRGGKAYTGVQFKNIFQRLKRKYSLFKRMISSTGFSWNSETQTVSASDLVWEGFLKGNKEAKQFRKGGLERYDDLRQIFGDNIANGGRAFASSQEVPPQRIVSDPSFALNMEANDYGQSRFSPRTSRASSEDREHRQDNPPAGLYKRKNRADEFSDAVAALLESTALRKAQLAASSGFHLEDGDFSMVKAMDILNAMEELDEDQYVAASSRLDDPNWRQRFILTPSNKRLWLINALLRTSSRP